MRHFLQVWLHVLMLGLLPLLVVMPSVHAQTACKVLDPALQGRYTGPCLDGLAHGLGEAAGPASHYRGEFVAGRKQGRGVQTWSGGDRYEGAFAGDLREGMGEYVWGAGSEWAGQRYRGEFRADQRHGEGSYHWSDGRVLSGRWERDLPTPLLAAQMSATVNAYALHLTRTAVPGARVCRTLPLGIGGRDLVGGLVRRVEAGRLWIFIDRPGSLSAEINGQPLKVGAEVVDHAESWVVCR